MKTTDTLIGIIGLIIAIVAALYSKKYGLGSFHKPGPGFLPFIVSIILIFLTSLIIIKGLVQRDKRIVNKISIGSKWLNIIYLMAASLLYTLMWNILGFLLDTFLLMGFLVKVIGQDSLKRSILIAILTSLLSYIIFKKWLNCQLSPGIFNLQF